MFDLQSLQAAQTLGCRLLKLNNRELWWMMPLSMMRLATKPFSRIKPSCLMRLPLVGRVWIAMLVLALSGQAEERTISLKYAPASVANPLKGLVPYAGEWGQRFPHTMEFNYICLGELVTGPEQYNWKPLEELLNDIASRGHQAIFRIYMEYPGKTNILPKYLVEGGLTVHKYLYTETQPEPPAPIETPDYNDPKLRAMLRHFIAALGQRYDGDPRIGYITAGLLGVWGEWHTYPREELFANKAVQAEVMDAYEAAFRKTPVLLRYPAGPTHERYAPNAQRRFGYHDDSFAWATLHTGKKGDEWFYMTVLQQAGALDKWKTQPIGGEIRPEAWGKVFDAKPGNKKIQNFRACVDATHVTWLMDTGMFEKKATAERRQRAEAEVRRMGYEFHIPRVTLQRDAQRATVRIEVQNRGVAPLYHDWKPEFGWLVEGRIVARSPGTGQLTGLLPGEPNRIWTDTLETNGIPDHARLLMRVPNPLPNGPPIRFANVEQDRDQTGWLTLTP